MGRDDGSLGEGQAYRWRQKGTTLEYILEEEIARLVLHMENKGGKGIEDAPYDIGLTSWLNDSAFH